MQTQTIHFSDRFSRCGILLSLLIAFIIPIEHKYDKFLRFFSLKIIPSGLALPPGFDKKIYLYASDLIALSLFVLLIFVFKVPFKRLIFGNGSLFLWGIFISAIVSLYVSPFSHYLTAYARLIQLLTPIFLYSFLTNTGSLEIKPFFYAIVLAATLQSCIAIAQYFTQDHLGLRLLSESRDPPAVFYMENAKLWIFDSLFGGEAPASVIKRARGTLPHSNILGGFFVLSIMATYALIAKEKKKVLFAALLTLQFFALSITFSRAAIFAVIIGTFIWFLLTFLNKKSYRFLGFAVLFSGVLCSTLLIEQSLARGGLYNYNETTKNADKERLDAQATAFKMIQNNPISGVGFQQLSIASTTHKNIRITAHNIYLFVLAEMGFLAFFSLLGFIWFVLFKAIRAPFSPEIASLTGAFIAFLFIGCCDFYLITSQQGKLMFFLTAALLVSKAREAHGKLENI